MIYEAAVVTTVFGVCMAIYGWGLVVRQQREAAANEAFDLDMAAILNEWEAVVFDHEAAKLLRASEYTAPRRHGGLLGEALDLIAARERRVAAVFASHAPSKVAVL